MHYYSKVLILGEPDTIHLYASRAFGEPGEDNDTYFEWYREIKVLEDTCSLEIDAVTSISADLDEILEKADGIVYFLNPLNQEESELFNMLLPDIFEVKREIPTVVIFYDQNGIIPLSVNDLLTKIWVSYPSLEAFVNLKPYEFHQALQSLCLAIINGDTPLNIENAWMRFPIYIQMANVYFNNKNYYYAAQAVRKSAQIAEIYSKEEYYIIADQAAYLFSKINLYLEASKILENIDRPKSKNFKKLYVDAMLGEASIFFNKQEYITAAVKYERAGQWASIESLERELVSDAFKLAITSWISACQVEKAFRILENLPHQDGQNILKNLSEKIGAAAEFLVSVNKFELAKEQLYKAINKYQIKALSDNLKYLTHKLTEILIQLFKIQVEASEIYAAKYTYDEIENMWDPTSYKVEKKDLDSVLKLLIQSFLEKNNFGIAATLINKLNSSILKKDLSKISADFEDKYKDSIKKEIQEYIKKGEKILAEFVNAEFEIITDMNKKQIKEIEPLIKQNKHLKAGIQILSHANHLKKIGKENIMDQILTKSLDIFIDGEIFEEFFIAFNSLSKEMKKKYLNRVYPIFLDKLKGIEKLGDYERKEQIFENSNRIYRNHSLYDKSKEISLVFIKNIKKKALAILNDYENKLGIERANELVKKATDILDAYLERGERAQVNFDKIYKKITEIYIELGDLHSAHVYNDRIENKAYTNEIHKKIAELETERSNERTRKAEESQEGEELKKGFLSISMIEKIARDALIDQKPQLKERKALKRYIFQEGLNHIKNNDSEGAILVYKKTVSRLINMKKYNLAGVSLAIVSLLLIRENKFEEIKEILEKTKEKLSGLDIETFSVTLIEYIIRVRKFQDEKKVKKAVSFMKNLPLFEEELKILYEYLGEEYKREGKREPIEKKIQVEIDQRFSKIESKEGDARKDKDIRFKRRKVMRKRYYSTVLELMEEKKYEAAAIEYLQLTNRHLKKNDFETSSLMILLYGLSLLKAGESLKLIKKKTTDFLNSLGVNKKLIEETLYIMLILFIIDIKIYSLDNYMPKIKGMLKLLPLFEEEEQLINIQ